MEQVSVFSGYDVTGMANELLQDPSFIYDINLISCECDLTAYINPKTSAIIKVFKTAYMKHKINNMNKQINKVVDNKDLLEQMKNIKIENKNSN